GAQVQVAGFDRPEVAFDAGQVLVGRYGAGGAELAGRDRGADDVDAVQGGLGVDGRLVPPPGQAAFADVEDEVLGDLVPVDDLPGPQPDLVRVFDPAGAYLVLDLGQEGFGGGEQVLALAGPLGGQGGVAAGDQPFARVVRAGDLG